MSINADDIFTTAIREGLIKGITQQLQGYNGPLAKLIEAQLSERSAAIKTLLESSIQSAVGDPAFVDEIKSAVRTTLAKTLVQKFGGELEKQVNALKSDPTTRARITIAIEEIVASKGK